ncbi:cupredoxin domain-containing protein [Alicyclobacillus tolerans]|uniref:cupredoxin domain-containing protein n=1 Tax=Alicyclobacillus tolerans TaxID=90970 RepID=UPI001F3820E1|nr:cupredoxin domain-containing protein [Alicyclobacillus tolerans]MCF8566719.1 cupredoxin domain-containing protein [Alicyclobacillus tolerans]
MKLLHMVSVSAAVIGTAALTAPQVTQASVRTVYISITDRGFAPNHVLTVANQPVSITVVNNGHQIHQFSIPHYRIYTENLKPGAKSNIQFSPWTVGRFEMMSDPSGKDQPEFTGQFTVTDQK